MCERSLPWTLVKHFQSIKVYLKRAILMKKNGFLFILFTYHAENLSIYAFSSLPFVPTPLIFMRYLQDAFLTLLSHPHSLFLSLRFLLRSCVSRKYFVFEFVRATFMKKSLSFLCGSSKLCFKVDNFFSLLFLYRAKILFAPPFASSFQMQ